jgi:hypothetical protein
MEDRTAELFLTYAELGERLGLAAEGARAKAKRKARAGEWAITVGNDGRARVRLPARSLPERPPDRPPERPDDARPAVQETVERLSIELARALAEAREARARHEKAAEELVAARLDAVRAAAALEAGERAHAAEASALHQRIEELRVELERARRPWWRRLLG